MRLKTFSASMYKTFKQCKKKVLYQNVMYLCTFCYKGKMERSKVDGVPSRCDNCQSVEVKPAPMQRGMDFDNMITAFIAAGGEGPLPQITNLGALEAVHKLAAMVKAALTEDTGAKVYTQKKIYLDAELNLSPETGRTVTCVLDVLIVYSDGSAQVIDWKTGSLTKKGKLKGDALISYIEQLELYGIATLTLPGVTHVDTSIYFLDAPPNTGRSDGLSYAHAANYEYVKSNWQKIVMNVMSEERFDASAGWWCGWCPYAISVGGPCEKGV